MPTLEKIRVLHLIPNFNIGGAEMMVKNLLLAHDRNRFEVAACSLFPKKGTAIDEELEKNNIKVFYLKKRIGLSPKIPLSIYKIFKTFKPDVVHTHLYLLGYVIFPALFCRIPVKIHTIHTLPKKEVGFAGKVIGWFAFRLLGVKPVGLSPQISRTIEKLYQIKNVPYIYNGVPVNDYYLGSDIKQKTRRLLTISDKQFVLIHIGNFSPPKNHKLLIEAFSKVHFYAPDVLLLLVGDGVLRAEIESFVKSKKLESNVRFLGTRKDIPELLSASDLFVLSSDWEGIPTVVLETMASGKPVVATAVGGVPELIDNSKTGILVPPHDADALSQAILKVIRDFAEIMQFSNETRLIVKKRFDITATCGQYEKLYLEILGKKRRS